MCSYRSLSCPSGSSDFTALVCPPTYSLYLHVRAVKHMLPLHIPSSRSSLDGKGWR